MQLCSRFLLLTIFVALAHAGDASAQGFEQVISLDRPVCEAPISTCNFAPEDASSTYLDRRDDCPVGYSCVCVGSCPQCDDCDAQVCVADERRECDTACDCNPGLGCFNHRCLPGFAAVFCCDSDICPEGQQCQRRTGEHQVCEGDPVDPMCRERIGRVSRTINKIVERNSRCSEDRDCAAIDTGTQCVGSCGRYINHRRADWVERRIDRVDRRLCGDFEEDGCSFEAVACPAVVLRPSCRENRCTGVPGGPLTPWE